MARRHDASVPLLPLLPLADPRGDANPIKNEVYNIIRRRMGRDKKGGGKRREGGREGGKGGEGGGGGGGGRFPGLSEGCHLDRELRETALLKRKTGRGNWIVLRKPLGCHT